MDAGPLKLQLKPVKTKGIDARLEELPLERRQLYNYDRRSKVLVKDL